MRPWNCSINDAHFTPLADIAGRIQLQNTHRFHAEMTLSVKLAQKLEWMTPGDIWD